MKPIKLKRGVIRVEELGKDVRMEVRTYFGTMKSAYIQLELDEKGIPYHDFLELMKGQFHTKERVSVVTKTWAKYKKSHRLNIRALPDDLAPPKRTRRRMNSSEQWIKDGLKPKKQFKFLED
jgi:hypothetical protein